MISTVIGIVAEEPAVSAEWARLVEARGYNAYRASVREVHPAHQIHLWLVILDPRTAPSRVAFRLRHLTERIVLITPHLQAGQYLANWVPTLSLVCAPCQARAALDDVLSLAQSMSGGVVTLTSPAQVSLC